MKSNIGCISTTIDDNARASKAARHTRSLPRLVPRPLRVSAAVTEKSVAPANIPFFSFLFFFFSKGAFPFLSYCYVTVDREPPQEETIPFSSTRMRSSPSTDYLNGQRKATERKEREKKIKTSPPLRRGLRRYHSTRYEVTPSSVHTRAYTYVHAYVHETGERGGVGERETEEERERESLYPPRFETSLRQAGLLDSTEDSRYSYPPFSAVPPSPGRE